MDDVVRLVDHKIDRATLSSRWSSQAARRLDNLSYDCNDRAVHFGLAPALLVRSSDYKGALSN